MAIPEGYKANFEILLRAAKNDDLALLETTDKKTGATVVAVVAINFDGKDYSVTPLAKMFDGDPFEELNPPD